jgi:hypothetical protein
MLEVTLNDVLGGASPQFSGGCLVCFSPQQSMASDWLPVDPWHEVLFGRAAGQQLGVLVAPRVAGDASLSRLHASLVVDDRGAYLVDLGSTNGTWLNGWRLPARRPARLASGAHFRVGRGLYAWLDAQPRLGPGGASWLEPGEFERTCAWELERTCQGGGPVTVLSVLDDAQGRLLGSDGVHPDWSVQLRSEDCVGQVEPNEWAVLMPRTGLELAGVLAALMLSVRARTEAGSVPAGLRIGLASVQAPGPESAVRGAFRRELATLETLLASARADRELGARSALDVARLVDAEPGEVETAADDEADVHAWVDAGEGVTHGAADGDDRDAGDRNAGDHDAGDDVERS